MISFGEAIKRPFSDVKALAIGAVLLMVSGVLMPVSGAMVAGLVWLVLTILVDGYYYYAAKSALKGDLSMPKWTDWGDLFVKGLCAAVIDLIWMIPATVVFLVVAGSAFLSLMTSGGVSNPQAMMGLLSGGTAVGVLIAFGLLLLTVYVLPAATLAFVDTGSIMAGFHVGDVFKKAFRGVWFVTWLKMIPLVILFAIVTGILGWIAGMIGGLGTDLTQVLASVLTSWATFAMVVTGYTLFAGAYEA